MTLVEILRAGKARILEFGWYHHYSKLPTLEVSVIGRSPCCAMTAMYPETAATSNSEPFEFFRKINGITTCIGNWNDAPERTIEDVLAAYDKAIAAAEALEQPT